MCKWVWRGRIEGAVRIRRVRNRVSWSKSIDMKRNLFREVNAKSNRELKIATLLEMLLPHIFIPWV